MAVLNGIHIISLVGPQGTGKSEIGKALAANLGCNHIEASSVVRSICGDVPRADMYKTNVRTKTDPGWLGNAIKDQITENTDSSAIVLTGVREVEVHDTLQAYGAIITIFEIWAPADVRFERLLNKKCSSWEAFQQQEENEWSIGLAGVLSTTDYTFDNDQDTTPIQVVVDEIVDYLETVRSR